MPGGAIYVDRVLVGAGSGPLGGFPVQQTLLVDPGNPQASDSTGIDLPYVTIQAALNGIGVPVDLADQKRRFTIAIASGQYDEDLVTPASRRLTLLPLGPVTLGDGAANVNFGSTTPRNILIDGTPAFGGRSTFSIGTVLPGCIYGDRCTQANAFDISGNLTLDGSGMALGTEQAVRLNMTRVRGNISASAGSLTDIHCTGVRVDGSITQSPGIVALVHGNRSYFVGAISLFEITHASLCKFESDITVAAGPTIGALDKMPPGFYGCQFNAGPHTFTGPAGSLFVDAASNYWFKTDGWLLGGAASKTIIGDLVP